MKGEIGIISTCFVVGSICCLKHKQTTGGTLKESFSIVRSRTAGKVTNPTDSKFLSKSRFAIVLFVFTFSIFFDAKFRVFFLTNPIHDLKLKI